jgi:hypothetical protein
MKRSSLVVLVVVLFAAACGSAEIVTTSTVPPDPPDGVAQLNALASARLLWEDAPTDYTVSARGETLAVRGEEVVSLGVAETTTIDDVFGTIERSIRAGAAVEVEYDRKLGYPTRVIIDRDADGTPDVDLAFGDLEAMTTVESLDQLLAAKALWEAQGLDSYRYIFRADCTCPDGGTFDVEVHDGRVTRFVPLDEAAETSLLTPTSMGAAFDDLEQWFRDSAGLIDEGILAVDVKMDPEFGYPRWFHIDASAIDDGPFEGPFTIVVTIDVVLPFVPIDDERNGGGPSGEDEQALEVARALWDRADLQDYRYLFTLHCECPLAVSGPFEITVRDGILTSAVHQGEPGGAQPDVVLIDELFESIATAVRADVEVDVTYDDALGYPAYAVLDVDAVPVDGGMAFTVSEFEGLGLTGHLAGRVVAGPQCPVQQDPPQPGCEDQPVTVSLVVRDASAKGFEALVDVVDGRFIVPLEPGDYVVEAPPLEMYMGTPAVVAVTVRSGTVTEIELHYDTGIR